MLWSYTDELNEIADGFSEDNVLNINRWVINNNDQVGVIITDKDSRILRVNEVFTGITGYDEEEIDGKTPRVLQSGIHDAAYYADMWRRLSTKGHWHGYIVDRNKDGYVYPEWLTITAIPDKNGKTVYYVATFMVEKGPLN